MPDVKNIKNVKAIKPAEKNSKNEQNSKKLLSGFKRFFTETRAEFRKIVWPTPKQVLNNTIVVIVMIIAVGAVIWVLDALSSSALNFLFGKYGQ